MRRVVSFRRMTCQRDDIRRAIEREVSGGQNETTSFKACANVFPPFLTPNAAGLQMARTTMFYACESHCHEYLRIQVQLCYKLCCFQAIDFATVTVTVPRMIMSRCNIVQRVYPHRPHRRPNRRPALRLHRLYTSSMRAWVAQPHTANWGQSFKFEISVSTSTWRCCKLFESGQCKNGDGLRPKTIKLIINHSSWHEPPNTSVRIFGARIAKGPTKPLQILDRPHPAWVWSTASQAWKTTACVGEITFLILRVGCHLVSTTKSTVHEHRYSCYDVSTSKVRQRETS